MQKSPHPFWRPFVYLWLIVKRGFSDTICLFGWKALLVPPITFLVGFGVHWALWAYLPEWRAKVGDPMTEYLLWVVYGCVPVTVFVIVASVFNILMSPSRIHHEQQKEINRLENIEQSPLLLEWHESRDVQWQNRNKLVEVSVWAVNRSDSETIDDVSMTVQLEVVRAEQVESARKTVEQIKDAPLKLKTARSQSDPITSHTLHPTDCLEFQLLKAERGGGSFVIFVHGKESRFRIGKNGEGRSFWQNYTHKALDQGTYRITVALKGRNMKSQSLSFVVTSKGRKLTFQRD